MKAILLLVALVMMALVAACGGDDDSSSATQTAAPTTTNTTGPGTNVAVGVQEWSINPAVQTAPAGQVTFNVTNTGPKEEHEFVILKTDLTAAELPKLPDGSIDEENAVLTSPGEIEGMGTGESKSATFDLEPGKYVFICNLIDHGEGDVQVHFVEGMHAEFTVE